MTRLLRAFVDLREGEARPLAHAFLALVMFVAGHTMLETARDALFLTKLPTDRLTLVYAVLAVLAFVTTALNTRFVTRFGRRNALIFTLMIAAYGTTVLYFEPKSSTVVFILYVWSALLGTIINVQFWMFAAQLFTIAQGKRLFAPITAGGALGAVTGASIAAFAVRAMSVDSLLLISAGFFVTTSGLLTGVVVDDSHLAIAAIKAAKVTPTSAMQGGLVRFFRSQPYLQSLACLVALGTGAVLAADYMFKSAVARLGTGNEIGAFLGTYYAIANGASLVVQTMIASRILRRQGVPYAIRILPVLLVAGSVGVLATGGLFALVLAAKGVDLALRYSLHRTSSELLWIPVAGDARDRGKALIDGVLSRAAQAVTAGIILVLSLFGFASPAALAVLVLVLSIGWLVVAVAIRQPYRELLGNAIRKGTIDLESTTDELDLNSVEALLEFLSSRDPQRVTATMDLLVERKRARIIPGLILYHDSEAVLLRALEIFATDARDSWLSAAERLLSDPRPNVRIAALRAFGQRGLLDRVEKGVDDPIPAVRASAIFCLVQGNPAIDAPLTDPRIRGLLGLEGEDGISARTTLLDSVRDFGDARWSDFILEMAGSAEHRVVGHAAAAMLRVKDTRFIAPLLERLDMRDQRTSIRAALVELGDPALDALEKALFDPTIASRIRLHIPRTISKFANQRAVDVLTRCLVEDNSGVIRYKALRGLGRLTRAAKLVVDREKIEMELVKNLVEHLRMIAIQIPLSREMAAIRAEAQSSGELVLGLLRDKSHQALERAFRLLQIAHPNEDIRSAYLAIQSEDRRIHANAQEFLDVLSTARAHTSSRDGDKRELLRIVADDLSKEDRISRAARFLPGRPSTYAESLAILVRENDEYLASLAAYHALESGTDAVRQDALSVYRKRAPSGMEWLSAVFSPVAEAVGG